MPSRDELVARMRSEILERTGDALPAPSAAEFERAAARTHAKHVSGSQDPDPTEVAVRMHGTGVEGHRVPIDVAAPLLGDIQKTLTWIGSALRQSSEVHATGKGKKEKGIRRATRMYLEPQQSPGSVIFHLIADPVTDGPSDGLFTSASQSTILDSAISEFLVIIESAESDDPASLGSLTGELRKMGPNVASALDSIAKGMSKKGIDLDITWTNPTGKRTRATIGKRGAEALRYAVEASKSEVRTIEMLGRLETVSMGADPIRLETPSGEDFRMVVDPSVGTEVGPLFGAMVLARAEETIVRQTSGRVRRTYRLLSATKVEELEE